MSYATTKPTAQPGGGVWGSFERRAAGRSDQALSTKSGDHGPFVTRPMRRGMDYLRTLLSNLVSVVLSETGLSDVVQPRVEAAFAEGIYAGILCCGISHSPPLSHIHFYHSSLAHS